MIKTYSAKLAEAKRNFRSVEPKKRDCSHCMSAIGHLLKTRNPLYSGDDYQVSVTDDSAGVITVKCEDPNLFYDGVNRGVYYRGGRPTLTIKNVQIAQSLFKYLLYNPLDFGLILDDDRLQVNHMVIGYGRGKYYDDKPTYSPLYEAEIPSNLELISRNENNIHGRFVHACGLEGLRVPVSIIPYLEPMLFERVGCDNFSATVSDEVYDLINELPASVKTECVRVASNKQGYFGRVNYMEFL